MPLFWLGPAQMRLGPAPPALRRTPSPPQAPACGERPRNPNGPFRAQALHSRRKLASFQLAGQACTSLQRTRRLGSELTGRKLLTNTVQRMQLATRTVCNRPRDGGFKQRAAQPANGRTTDSIHSQLDGTLATTYTMHLAWAQQRVSGGVQQCGSRGPTLKTAPAFGRDQD